MDACSFLSLPLPRSLIPRNCVVFKCRIFAPTTYIFFASAIPVISFGEQLDRDTSKTIFCVGLICLLYQNYT